MCLFVLSDNDSHCDMKYLYNIDIWHIFYSHTVLGPIHTKDARFFCCGNSAAVISKPHTSKWGTLADDVFPSANFTLPPKPRPPTGPI